MMASAMRCEGSQPSSSSPPDQLASALHNSMCKPAILYAHHCTAQSAHPWPWPWLHTCIYMLLAHAHAPLMPAPAHLHDHQVADGHTLLDGAGQPRLDVGLLVVDHLQEQG